MNKNIYRHYSLREVIPAHVVDVVNDGVEGWEYTQATEYDLFY
ncbi:MAG: hypothetical protein WBA07_20560 [Rivularia sp. (in: cyanobacteria)]